MSAWVQPIRVLIADDQTLFRAGLAHMLESDPRIRVVGQASDGIDAVEQALASHPDVVLMDVQMPGADGVEATRMLAGKAPDVDVLLLSAYADGSVMRAGLAGGAKGFVHKDVAFKEVIASILDVRSARASHRRPVGVELSVRELSVVQQVGGGLSNKQIARRLGISEKTVRNHLNRAFGKLGATNRTEAVIIALHAGLLTV